MKEILSLMNFIVTDIEIDYIVTVLVIILGPKAGN